MQKTIALLFDNFGPYHLARLKGARTVLGETRVIGVQIHDQSADYAWSVTTGDASSLGLQTICPHASDGFVRKPYYVWRHLNRLNPAAVAIAGYASTDMLAAVLWCRCRKRAAVLVSESKEDDAPRYRWKEAIKRCLLRLYDCALVGGHPQRRYIHQLGFPYELIFTQINVVGNEDYHPARIRGLPSPIREPFFLLTNRFIPKKNLSFVLECYARYHRKLIEEQKKPWNIVLAGDGELRDSLKSQVAALRLSDSVHFPGFLQQNELLPYLAHCEVFIHASTTEQWGLVVNEAMAAGRPVFISRRCGCFEDLIIEGETGLGFDPFRHAELIELMTKATGGHLPLEALGAAGLRHIDQFSPASFGRTLGIAVEQAIKRAHARSSS